MIKRIINQLLKEQLRKHYLQVFVICSALFAGVLSLVLLMVISPSDGLLSMMVGMGIAAGLIGFVAYQDGE